MPLLEVRDIHTYYGHIHALKGVSLTVEEGEIVTLIGANGAGKSTTLRTISGMNRPRKGEVIYQGQPIHKLPADRIVALGLGHVPEGRRIFPRMTVEENLDMGGFLIRDPRVLQERKEQVFTLFPRLAERRHQKGGTLSGGEQQMLAIGRALMQDPRLLLMDEPSMGLAPVLVDFIFEIIQKLNQQGKTILLVEQNARLALQIAHRGYVLQTGQLTLSGPARELAARPEIQEAYLGGR
ncbi:MAG: ABC transporter ATP-binding protein [Meiothermus sp.]|uniref:ABC transporter ATP-binding protein n=1 Tax=Meiothermus sp. TaxID=1955249 RepID=UPI0025F45ABA|nr:ABC transporter ATP-binding protein [Meiothermus sp.]MCS7059066.1 ABC transporter ATP-binding protein [Meiothermus sp.]MCS7195562.1 ABC transporter ATP-binding protein [Meiothermus sp.]MCX7740711.1 ABC transporter ATP-binding protein [Meiothermus sp.]MDW8090490.1 ABC transporter ATP-binding protein [Meiothermus sp.]MDW8481009.1 ABC transporter ATP-binding protein [Meiothermus sp.]